MDYGRTKLTVQTLIEVPRERVWWALTDPEGLCSWLCDRAAAPGPMVRAGDRFELQYWTVRNEAEVLHVERPDLLLVENTYTLLSAEGTPSRHTLRTAYRLSSSLNRTLLVVTVAGFGPDDIEQRMREQWAVSYRKVLLNLKSVLELGIDLREPLFHPPRIGAVFATLPPHRAHETGCTHGCCVLWVQPGGPAARAGLQPGDIITAWNGQPVIGYADLARMVASHRGRDPARVTWVRGGVEVSAGILPDRPSPGRTE